MTKRRQQQAKRRQSRVAEIAKHVADRSVRDQIRDEYGDGFHRLFQSRDPGPAKMLIPLDFDHLFELRYP